jgi:SAM-dependent methyltransferase
VRRTAPRRVRKGVFGRDPSAYDRARLPYPKAVYDVLRSECGLRPPTRVFEIGPGTGIATRELIRLGADPIALIEPDRRLARFLRTERGFRGPKVSIICEPFERTALPAGQFDLGVAASSFHWLPERLALRKVARALRPGGWWSTWNTHHGDPYRSNEFHELLQPLYRELDGRSSDPYTRARAARDRHDRLRALRSVGEFDRISRRDIRWSVSLTPGRVRSLWATFSDIVTLPPSRRVWFLDALERTVQERFGSTVSIPLRTPMYTARRV